MDAVIHFHSSYSYDCVSDPREIVDEAIKRSINVICITDHDTINGSLAALEYAKTKYGDKIEVVPGAEYCTEFGDVICLGMKEEISFSNYADLIRKAKSQGAMILLPHPFKSHKNVEVLAKDADAIEIFNGRCTTAENESARQLAERLGKPVYVASDAHFIKQSFGCVNHFAADMKENFFDTLRYAPRRFTTENTPEVYVHLSQLIKGLKRKDFKLLKFHCIVLTKHFIKKIIKR
jgi:predicted metal-dependent phosphoesterase TrpH